jgi:hypothetical protein
MLFGLCLEQNCLARLSIGPCGGQKPLAAHVPPDHKHGTVGPVIEQLNDQATGGQAGLWFLLLTGYHFGHWGVLFDDWLGHQVHT